MPQIALRPLLGSALAALVLLACHPNPPPTEPVEEDPSSDVGASDAGTEPVDPAEAPADAERAKQQAEVDALTRKVTNEVAGARGLAVKAEFAVQLIDKPGVRTFVRDALYEELTPAEVQLLGRVDAALGVLPVGSDAEQVLLDLYELGVLGIYDPKKKTLLIGDFIGSAELGRVVGHEGAHGLQDMHFDLEALSKMTKGRSDLDTAKTFLIEGDAEAAYLAWMSGEPGLAAIGDDLLTMQADMVLLADETMIPHPVLVRMMQMPYTEGTASVVRLARAEGFAAVDALYSDLPTTSEQMLHLDKLAKREPALPITIDPKALLALAPGHRPAWEDELGEAGLLAMLAEVERPDGARRAAAGWGGDRFVVLEHETNPAAAPLLVGVIAWDSEAEAKEFEPLFRAYLEEKKSTDFVLERRRSHVLFATHFQEPLAGQTDPSKALAKAGWASFEVGKPPKPGKSSKSKSSKQSSQPPAAEKAATP